MKIRLNLRPSHSGLSVSARGLFVGFHLMALTLSCRVDAKVKLFV